MRRLFYAVVLVVALYGAATGAVATFHLPWWIAVGGVVALELGGVVFLNDADTRRRLGEHAHLSRLVGGVIAGAAATFNAATHDSPLLGGFFALMSGLGFVSWWIDVENQRRDRLRARGQLPPPAPRYELWGHTIRHPIITARARSLAKAHPELGLYGSLEAALIVRRRELRNAALADVLRARIRNAVGDDLAAIATSTFDVDEIARRLSADPDYDGFTALLATELTAERILQGPDDHTAESIHEPLGRNRHSATPTLRPAHADDHGKDSARAATNQARRRSTRPPANAQPSRIAERRRLSSPLPQPPAPPRTAASQVLEATPAVTVDGAGPAGPVEELAAADECTGAKADRHPSDTDHPTRGTVRVKMIDGPMIVGNDGRPVRGLRAKSLELLAFLVVHRSGAAITEILDAVWQGVPAEKASQRLSTVVSNLRNAMREVLKAGTPTQAAGPAAPEPIINTGGRYHLNREVVIVDHWELIDATRPTPDVGTIGSSPGLADGDMLRLTASLEYPWLRRTRLQADS
ncbi:hypothetical protein AB0K00_42630 [Dactylosporangium sp. NPDC049525]|uniref:hypothetical protein n=1 Tax=Dactylosporangium sp. NPDC049525 TaxID=3154730 RepID=UPI003435F4FB